MHESTGGSVQNTAELRSFNTKRILDYMRSRGAITKRDLASALGLSFPTVSNICNELVSGGILRPAGSDASGGGRSPALLSLEEGACPAICMDLRQSSLCELAVVNLRGKSLGTRDVAIADRPLEEALDRLRDEVLSLLDELDLAPSSSIGVGVAAPGILNRADRKIVNSTNPVFEGARLVEALSERLTLPVHVENESNLLALAASMDRSLGEELRDIIYLYIGEGVGVGIVSNGALVVGSRGLGGEIEHMPIGLRGFECHCGNRGCVEPELVKSGFLAKYGVPGANWEDFAEAVRGGVPGALAVAEENGKLIGTLLSVMVNIFDPELVLLAGIVEDIYDAMEASVAQELDRRLVSVPGRSTRVSLDRDYKKRVQRGCAEFAFAQWRP